MAHATGDDGTSLDESCALILVDVQSGFDDRWWGSRNNPDADRNIAELADGFGASGRPVVHVRHDSDSPDPRRRDDEARIAGPVTKEPRLS